MNPASKKIILLAVAIFFLFQGCLKDNVSPTINISISNAALELNYFEENGDYINSDQMPSIVKTDEVYNNINTYLIVDVRSHDAYVAGHIAGAFNIQHDSLLQFLTGKNIQTYPKVVLVDENGQASSYYTCLLRLYGFNNIYNLLFGMAEWNKNFSAIWENNINKAFAAYSAFYNKTYPFPEMTPLPDVTLNNSFKNLSDKIKDRIASLIKEGFNYNTNFVYVSDLLASPTSYYIACYGKDSLYYHYKEDSKGSGHYINTVLYHPSYDIKSTFHLQTFPNDRKILIYSYSGHLSAYLAAYLRALGYDAKTLMYGASAMFYFYLSYVPTRFYPYIFFTGDVRNYPYTTGEQP